MTRYRAPTGVPAYVLKLQDALEKIHTVGSPWVLLVTGSREAEREVWGNVITDCLVAIEHWLDRIPSLSGAGVPIPRAKILRHGGARGIDTLAHLRSRNYGYQPDRMPADWQHWGRRSGLIRSQAMVDKLPRADLCLALFAEISKGTAECAGMARAAGIPTVSITVEDLYMPHKELPERG